MVFGVLCIWIRDVLYLKPQTVNKLVITAVVIIAQQTAPNYTHFNEIPVHYAWYVVPKQRAYTSFFSFLPSIKTRSGRHPNPIGARPPRGRDYTYFSWPGRITSHLGEDPLADVESLRQLHHLLDERASGDDPLTLLRCSPFYLSFLARTPLFCFRTRARAAARPPLPLSLHSYTLARFLSLSLLLILRIASSSHTVPPMCVFLSPARRWRINGGAAAAMMMPLVAWRQPFADYRGL